MSGGLKQTVQCVFLNLIIHKVATVRFSDDHMWNFQYNNNRGTSTPGRYTSL